MKRYVAKVHAETDAALDCLNALGSAGACN
jgi:hypothetical protein